MIEQLPDLPSGVIGFEAVGEVRSGDYEDVLRPAIDAAANSPSGIRLVYLLGARFDGYSAGASWQDAKLGMHHLKAWERTALVSDLQWVRHIAAGFGWMIPGEFRQFGLDEVDGAITWAASDTD